MWFNKNLKKLLDDSANLSSGNTLFITDLDNILYVTTGNNICNEYEENQLMSKELKQILDDYKITKDNNDPVLLNNKNIAIYQDNKFNTIWKSLMIFPIVISNTVYGSIISASYHKVFEERHIKYAKTTMQFITENIISFLDNKITEDSTMEFFNLFYDVNLDYVTNLLEEKQHLLENTDSFKQFQIKGSNIYDYLEKSLTEEEFKNFNRYLHYEHRKHEYENTLCFFMGMKLAKEISKL